MKNNGLPIDIDPTKQPFELYDDVDYQVFWSGWQQHKLDQVEHVVLKKMLPDSGHRLIDIGCGFGRLADCYLDRFQHVVMFDGSLSLLRQARQKTAGKATYIAGDLHHLPFRDTSFDCVVMIRVFHHVIESKYCLSGLHRILSGGGKLVFTYRNKLYLMNFLKWRRSSSQDNPFTIEPCGVGTTLISHHPTDIKRLLQRTGYTDLRYQGVGVMDRLANIFRPLGKFAPTGKFIAPVFGKIKIAPWMFCSAVSEGMGDLIGSGNIDEILMCIVCNGNLLTDSGGYTCLSCGRYYPIIDGIIDFRVH